MTSERATAAARLPFVDGVFEGRGHWINRQADGTYAVRYVVTRSFDGTVAHAVRREFFKPDGATLYVEETTLSFAPAPRNGITVLITGPKGSVAGFGYVFENQCHYEADVSAGTRLEFTFTVADGRIVGLASSASKDNFTSWREALDRVSAHPQPVADDPQPLP